jgi:hypothetical protein
VSSQARGNAWKLREDRVAGFEGAGEVSRQLELSLERALNQSYAIIRALSQRMNAGQLN